MNTLDKNNPTARGGGKSGRHGGDAAASVWAKINRSVDKMLD